MWPWAEVVPKRMPAQEQAASASCTAVGDAAALPCLLSVRQACDQAGQLDHDHRTFLPSALPISPQGMPKVVKGARIACLDMNLQKARMHFGVQVR